MFKNHLILGGCGFLGRHVALLLAQAGHRVRMADRKPPSFRFPEDIAHLISWQPLELTAADWDSVVGNADVVHHYAWTSIPASANANPLGDLNVNVLATIQLLESLRRRGGGRLIFSSSGGTVYGRLHQVPVSEDHPLSPITAYGAGKVTAEIYITLYKELYGLDCFIARLANPFGAGQNVKRGQGAATKFLFNALAGQPILVWGDGEVIRDYIHISDVARAMAVLATTAPGGGPHVFNIGSGSGISLNGLIEELELLLARPIAVQREPARSFDVPVSILDIARARAVLQWSPLLSLSQGLASAMRDLNTNAPLSSIELAQTVASRNK